MARQVRITFVIDKKGRVTAEAHGFQGRGCADAMRSLTRGLGREVEHRAKREMHETSATQSTGNGWGGGSCS